MSKNFIIPLVVYPFDLLVSVGQTDEQLYKTLDKFCDLTKEDKELLKYDVAGRGRSVLLDTNQGVLRIKNKPVTSDEKGFLAHEIFHIVTLIMYRIGMEMIIGKSDEAYAYCIGYITEEIYKQT